MKLCNYIIISVNYKKHLSQIDIFLGENAGWNVCEIGMQIWWACYSGEMKKVAAVVVVSLVC